MDTSTGSSAQEYYTRQASGLVRQISGWQAFIYNTYSINPVLTLAFMLLIVPLTLSGASMVWATVLVMILVVPLALVYSWFAALMPRSGGEYVYVSRTLSPTWGFAANWNTTIWFGFYLGAPCVLFGQWGVASILRALGATFGSAKYIHAANWVASSFGGFLLATLIILVLVILYIIRLSTYLTFQSLSFFLGMLGIVFMAGALWQSSHGHFIHAFDSYVASLRGRQNAYSLVEQQAAAGGFHTRIFSWWETLLAVAFPYLGLGFPIASSYFGGEVKRASRSQWFAILGSVLFSGLIMVVLLAGIGHTLSYPFLGQLDSISPGNIGLQMTPLFSELAALTTSNLFVAAIILLGFAAWTYVWAPVNIIIITRNLLAWSTDRVLPDWLADVGDRWHSPYKAIFVAWMLGEVFAYLYAYHPGFALLTGTLGMTISFIVTSVSAIILPRRLPDLFRSGPMRLRVASLPLISVIGLVSLVCLVGIGFALVFAPGSGISFLPSQGASFWMLLLNVGVFLSGFVVYYLARKIRMARGIDIRLAYKTLPPE
jgi:amino acid transporter